MYYCNYDVLYHFYIFYKILNIDSYIDFVNSYETYYKDFSKYEE